MLSTDMFFLILIGNMGGKGHIIFTYGYHTVVCVYLLSVFLTLPLLLNSCVERILSTMVQPTDKEN